jgi:hypothetical protein
MVVGVTDKLWEVSDIVTVLEQRELANYKPNIISWSVSTSTGRGIPSAFFGAAAK